MRGAAIPERLVPRARPGRAERGRGPPRGPGHATRPPPRRRRGSLVTRGCSNKLTFQYATITSAWCSVSLFHRSDPALTGSSRRTRGGSRRGAPHPAALGRRGCALAPSPPARVDAAFVHAPSRTQHAPSISYTCRSRRSICRSICRTVPCSSQSRHPQQCVTDPAPCAVVRVVSQMIRMEPTRLRVAWLAPRFLRDAPNEIS